jgi:hypothetical protein
MRVTAPKGSLVTNANDSGEVVSGSDAPGVGTLGYSRA